MPSEENWKSLYAQVRLQNGPDFNLYKQDQLRRRILASCETRRISTIEELTRLLKTEAGLLGWLVDRLAINVSELYRNPEKWRELELKVLPALLEGKRSLKIWSAGCSFGAEAYSLACVLEASFQGNHKILGTDIDETALSQAKEGVFLSADMRGVPAELKDRFFTPVGDKWQASKSLRQYTTFRRGDLLADSFDSGYDLIMCRNVVIYFNDEAKNALYRKFFDALRPGGVLFVGGTERIFDSKQIGFESDLPFFYNKPQEGAMRWRNAS